MPQMRRNRQQDSLRERVGTNIRRLRNAKEWSIEKLAIRSNLTADFVGKVERGVMNIGLDALGRIASVLGVDVHDLTKPSTQK